MTRTVKFPAFLILALLFVSPLSSWAQEIEEIIVTAQKREQALQDVPLSIVALDQTKLERMGIQEFNDYITAVPGISFNFGQGPNGTRGRRTVGIRGVQRFGSGTASTVGYYIDEIPVDIVNPRIFDINRIEVLRGPQGTLYGSGSVGGTIRLITNQPDLEEFSSRLEGTFAGISSGGEDYLGNAMVNIPLAEGRAALRLVGMYWKEGGWIDAVDIDGNLLDKDTNQSDIRSVRASLVFQATDRLKITPSVYWQRYELDAEFFITKDVDGFPKYSRTNFAETSSLEEFVLAGVTFDYAQENFQIISVTSYYDMENTSLEDFGGVANGAFLGNPAFGVPVVTDNLYKQKTWIHETRFVSDFGGKFEFIAGVFYEDGKRPFTSIAISDGFNDVFGFPLIPTDERGEIIFDTRLTRDQSQFALFGEGTYSITESLDFILGLRYFKFKSETTDDFTGFFFGGVPPLQAGDASEDGVNPKFSLTWNATEDAMLYATASKGFRPGNANFPLPTTCDASLIAAGITPPGAPNYDSDTLWSYEIGLKSAWADNRFILNVSPFYMDWKDLQLVVSLGSCGGISGFITNADAARSKGVDVEMEASPVDGLTLGLAATYLDAELTEDSVVLNAEAGSKLPYVSKWTVTGSVQFSFPIFDSSDAYARADIRYRSKAPLNIANTFHTDAYTQTDLRFGVNRGRWDFSVFAKNITNEDPILSVGGRFGSLAFGTHAISLKPRTIGVTVAASFD